MYLQVTEDNKDEYVRLVCQMKMTGAIRNKTAFNQFNCSLTGLFLSYSQSEDKFQQFYLKFLYGVIEVKLLSKFFTKGGKLMEGFGVQHVPFSKNPGGVLEPLVYRAVWYDGAVLNSVLNIINCNLRK